MGRQETSSPQEEVEYVYIGVLIYTRSKGLAYFGSQMQVESLGVKIFRMNEIFMISHGDSFLCTSLSPFSFSALFGELT